MNAYEFNEAYNKISEYCTSKYEKEIELVYYMYTDTLIVYNDFVILERIDKFSLSNFKKLLSMLKRDDFKILKNINIIIQVS